MQLNKDLIKQVGSNPFKRQNFIILTLPGRAVGEGAGSAFPELVELLLCFGGMGVSELLLGR